MNSSEAAEIFLHCNDVLKRLKRFNEELSSELKGRKSYSKSYYDDRYETMKSLTKSALEGASDAAENAGWWKRKVAATFVNDLLGQFKFIEIGMNLLRKRSGSN